jgi:hypothetical protein
MKSARKPTPRILALQKGYETGEGSVTEIAQDFHTSRGAILKLAREFNWKRRAGGNVSREAKAAAPAPHPAMDLLP